MQVRTPPELTSKQMQARLQRVERIARRMGFVGRIAYEHVYNNAGGASFGLAVREEDDLLAVFADAFDRDADPGEF